MPKKKTNKSDKKKINDFFDNIIKEKLIFFGNDSEDLKRLEAFTNKKNGKDGFKLIKTSYDKNIIIGITPDLCKKDDIQLGVFAAAKIPKGTVIGEYNGQIVDTIKGDYVWEIQDLDKSDPKKQKFIDAYKKGSLPRYINHSFKYANVIAVYNTETGKLEYIANEDIYPRDELVIDYGENYFKSIQYPSLKKSSDDSSDSSSDSSDSSDEKPDRPEIVRLPARLSDILYELILQSEGFSKEEKEIFFGKLNVRRIDASIFKTVWDRLNRVSTTEKDQLEIPLEISRSKQKDFNGKEELFEEEVAKEETTKKEIVEKKISPPRVPVIYHGNTKEWITGPSSIYHQFYKSKKRSSEYMRLFRKMIAEQIERKDFSAIQWRFGDRVFFSLGKAQKAWELLGEKSEMNKDKFHSMITSLFAGHSGKFKKSYISTHRIWKIHGEKEAGVAVTIDKCIAPEYILQFLYQKRGIDLLKNEWEKVRGTEAPPWSAKDKIRSDNESQEIIKQGIWLEENQYGIKLSTILKKYPNKSNKRIGVDIAAHAHARMEYDPVLEDFIQMGHQRFFNEKTNTYHRFYVIFENNKNGENVNQLLVDCGLSKRVKSKKQELMKSNFKKLHNKSGTAFEFLRAWKWEDTEQTRILFDLNDPTVKDAISRIKSSTFEDFNCTEQTRWQHILSQCFSRHSDNSVVMLGLTEHSYEHALVAEVKDKEIFLEMVKDFCQYPLSPIVSSNQQNLKKSIQKKKHISVTQSEEKQVTFSKEKKHKLITHDSDEEEPTNKRGKRKFAITDDDEDIPPVYSEKYQTSVLYPANRSGSTSMDKIPSLKNSKKKEFIMK